MSADIIEIRPGVRQDSAETFGPTINPIDLSDPDMERDVMRECRSYALAVHSKCYAHTSDDELAKGVRIASSLVTILQAIAAGRMARRAAAIALDVDRACKEALEAAEKL